MKYYLAIDIGASSGRHIIGYKDRTGNLFTEEIYRFPNGVKKVNNHLTWDIVSLFNHVKEGIKIAIEKYGNVESMSIDTWGVDYVLLNNDEEILPCYAYRDNRTKESIENVHNLISFDRLYEITGSQFQTFNTIYQLYKDKLDHRLDKATDFLYIPEYLMYKLTGVKKHEYTNASTSGMLDGTTNSYSEEIISKLDLPKHLFNKLEKQGTLVGNFTNDIIDEVGGNIKVVLCSTHDTASAVEGIPFKSEGLYLSSGTWSLLGIKIDRVITSIESKESNFSNEYGPSYIRYQKNIMGLWIIQGLAKQMNLSFPQMVELAEQSSYSELFDVNDDCFLSSLDMKQEIIKWFKRNAKEPPIEDKDIINTAYRSLAYSYKIAVNELERNVNKTYKDLYIVGGGAKNRYLNKLTNIMTGKHVIAHPIEATAIGNLLAQMKEN